VHASVRSSSHEPSFVDWIEAARVDRIKNRISTLLLLVALEGNHRFLSKRGSTEV
jgi:hypothetical protein